MASLKAWNVYEKGCPFNDFSFASADLNVDIDKMKWLKEHGCPWTELTFAWTARHGNLENMGWLFDNYCPWNTTIEVCRYRLYSNPPVEEDVIEWMQHYSCVLLT